MNRQIHVMVVDDQAIILEALSLLLAAETDIVLCKETNPLNAISRALDFKPHVFLLDLVMPEQDGLSLLAELRAHAELCDVPVVMLSGEEDPATKVAAFRAGANDYIVKLPSALELAARVRYHAKAYLAEQSRAEAFRTLMQSQMQLAKQNAEMEQQRLLLLQRNRELEEAAVTDALTGLKNRRFFKQFMEREIAPVASPENDRRNAAQACTTFYIFDLDHFKLVNDRLGHDSGDQVLIEVGKRLRELVRTEDAVMRWGGEEFMVVCRHHDRAGALALAQRMLDCIGTVPIQTDVGDILTVTCSMGFTSLALPSGAARTLRSQPGERHFRGQCWRCN
jgi:two-component system, chemotaxis family, response regulator WspR